MPERERPNGQFDVIVVGGGPIGLTIANLLGGYGASVCLLDRSPGLSGVPRAVALDDEGMRVMQLAGLTDRLAPHMLLGYDHRYFGSRGQLLLKVDPDTREHGYPKRNRFHQPILEQALLDGLDRFPAVEVRYGTAFRGYVPHPDGVEVTVGADDGEGGEVLRARFLVGADGGSSPVRRAAGIAMLGETHPQPWIVIDTENNDDTARYSRAIGDPRRPSVNVPGTEGRRRYEFMLLPGEDADQAVSEENIAALLAPHCDLNQVRVVRNAVYTFHSLVAERLDRDGVVFLAGDAAHMMAPFQGQGMNSGIRDAAMLSWRLAAAARGLAGRSLLASYDAERRPHAEDMVLLSQRVGRILMTRSRVRATLRDWTFWLLSRWPGTRGYLRNMGFKPKPRSRSGFFLADTGTLAGQLFPQPEVLQLDGRRALLDDVLGPGFALVHLARRAAPIPFSLDHPFWSKVKPRRVLAIPGGLKAVEDVDAVVGDIGGSLAAAAGGSREATLLLRPDRYVAAVIEPGREQDIAARLDRLL